MIVSPRILVLDTSSLISLSDDYFSDDLAIKERARKFINDISTSGIYIGLSLGHVIEFFRSQQVNTYHKRFIFCKQLPHIAWVKPYESYWFIDSIVGVHKREMHARVHSNLTDWADIIECVRQDVWQTGVGEDLFRDNGDGLWDYIYEHSLNMLTEEREVASLARVDPANILNVTIGELREYKVRNLEEIYFYLREYNKSLSNQLTELGDPRLNNPEQISSDFTQDLFSRFVQAESNGVEFVEHFMDLSDIPENLVNDSLTVGEISHLKYVNWIYNSIGKNFLQLPKLV